MYVRGQTSQGTIFKRGGVYYTNYSRMESKLGYHYTRRLRRLLWRNSTS
jgi:hypothetical protein